MDSVFLCSDPYSGNAKVMKVNLQSHNIAVLAFLVL